jgi:hypothetical protein
VFLLLGIHILSKYVLHRFAYVNVIEIFTALKTEVRVFWVVTPSYRLSFNKVLLECLGRYGSEIKFILGVYDDAPPWCGKANGV